MAIDAALLRSLLAGTIIGMALIAILYLCRRQLTLRESIGWGLLIILLPVLGPFLVIVLRPGSVTRDPPE